MKSILTIALLVMLAGCNTFQTQHQKIAAACEGAATAADTIAAGTVGGRISKDQAADALRVYRVTVPFCQPEPVSKLSDVDYAALVAAAAQLALTAEKAK